MPAWFLAEAAAPEILGSIGMDYLAADAAASAAGALGADVASGSLGDMLASQGFGAEGIGALGMAGGDKSLADLLATQPGFGGAQAGGGIMDWWKSLTNKEKMMYGGGAGLAALMLQERKKYGVPAQGYSGPLNFFNYNPRTYQPAVTNAPTPYAPQYQRYAAGGGIQGDTAMAQGQMPGALNMGTMEPVVRMAKGGMAKVDNMAAIDNYVDQASSGSMAAVLAKAKAGDYNAMLALNKLRGTPNQNYAGGGIASLGSYSDGGRLLRGPGDGMSDNIPANISGKQPARLADGEFVVPADVVSGLGNGSTDAGAKQLYKMLDKVRAARTGTKKQGKQINPSKYVPR